MSKTPITMRKKKGEGKVQGSRVKVQGKVEGRRSKVKKGKKNGRPSRYDPRFCDMAEVACEYGATDADLARRFTVREGTINNWKKAYPDFQAAVQRGKDKCDVEIVEASLFKLATGYSRLETSKRIMEDGKIVETTFEVYYPPKFAAVIAWLSNRSDRWRRNPDNQKLQQDRKPPQIVRFTDVETKAG